MNMRRSRGLAELQLLPPDKRLEAATEEVARTERIVNEYRAIRDKALLDLVEERWGYQRIGALLGVSKARAQQLVLGAKRRLGR